MRTGLLIDGVYQIGTADIDSYAFHIARCRADVDGYGGRFGDPITSQSDTVDRD